jgi:hypothetical protein
MNKYYIIKKTKNLLAYTYPNNSCTYICKPLCINMIQKRFVGGKTPKNLGAIFNTAKGNVPPSSNNSLKSSELHTPPASSSPTSSFSPTSTTTPSPMSSQTQSKNVFNEKLVDAKPKSITEKVHINRPDLGLHNTADDSSEKKKTIQNKRD